MNLDELLKLIEEKVKPYYIKPDGQPFDDVHDWAHMKRVYGACLKMLKIEPSANRGEVLMAALLHDTGRSRGNTDEVHAEDSYLIAKEILPVLASDFNKNNIDLEKVLLMVRYHTVSHLCPDVKIAASLEFNIFTDGDKIDMFGPSGVLRVPIAWAYRGKPTVYLAIARLDTMSKTDQFQFQSEAGKKIGQKYKDFLKTFIDALDKQRKDFEA